MRPTNHWLYPTKAPTRYAPTGIRGPRITTGDVANLKPAAPFATTLAAIIFATSAPVQTNYILPAVDAVASYRLANGQYVSEFIKAPLDKYDYFNDLDTRIKTAIAIKTPELSVPELIETLVPPPVPDTTTVATPSAMPGLQKVVASSAAVAGGLFAIRAPGPLVAFTLVAGGAAALSYEASLARKAAEKAMAIAKADAVRKAAARVVKARQAAEAKKEHDKAMRKIMKAVKEAAEKEAAARKAAAAKAAADALAAEEAAAKVAAKQRAKAEREKFFAAIKKAEVEAKEKASAIALAAKQAITAHEAIMDAEDEARSFFYESAKAAEAVKKPATTPKARKAKRSKPAAKELTPKAKAIKEAIEKELEKDNELFEKAEKYLERQDGMGVELIFPDEDDEPEDVTPAPLPTKALAKKPKKTRASSKKTMALKEAKVTTAAATTTKRLKKKKAKAYKKDGGFSN